MFLTAEPAGCSAGCSVAATELLRFEMPVLAVEVEQHRLHLAGESAAPATSLAGRSSGAAGELSLGAEPFVGRAVIELFAAELGWMVLAAVAVDVVAVALQTAAENAA